MSLLRNLAVAGKPLTNMELYEELSKDYGGERQCNPNAVMDNLFNMLSLGMISIEKEELDENQNLLISVAITSEGKAYSKYYPKDFKF
jgi:DNA-binding PadR family transcriptional regulator